MKTASQRRALTVTVPSDFHRGIEGHWSPEDLLVAAVATCYELTLRSIAEHRRTEFRQLEVAATGHVTQLASGRIGFRAIELDVRIEPESGAERVTEAAARKAHDLCIVGQALEVPVELKLELRSPASALA